MLSAFKAKLFPRRAQRNWLIVEVKEGEELSVILCARMGDGGSPYPGVFKAGRQIRGVDRTAGGCVLVDKKYRLIRDQRPRKRIQPS